MTKIDSRPIFSITSQMGLSLEMEYSTSDDFLKQRYFQKECWQCSDVMLITNIETVVHDGVPLSLQSTSFFTPTHASSDFTGKHWWMDPAVLKKMVERAPDALESLDGPPMDAHTE